MSCVLSGRSSPEFTRIRIFRGCLTFGFLGDMGFLKRCNMKAGGQPFEVVNLQEGFNHPSTAVVMGFSGWCIIILDLFP